MIIPLSDPAIRYAVEMCEVMPDYRIGIAIADGNNLCNIIDRALDFVSWDQYKCHFETQGRIVFKNGSQLDCFKANENAKMRRYNIVISDSGISQRIVNRILKPIATRQIP